MGFVVLLLGLLFSAFLVALTLVNGQKHIALATVALSAVGLLQYGLLEQLSAAALSGAALAIAAGIYFSVDSPRAIARLLLSPAGNLLALGLYVVVFAATSGGLHWDIGLLALVGGGLTAAVAMVKNVWLARLLLGLAGIAWSIFQFSTGAYTNLLGQGFYFAALIWMSARDLRKNGKVEEFAKALAPAPKIPMEVAR